MTNMHAPPQTEVAESEFRSWLHPDEPSRATLAVVGILPVVAFALLVIVSSFGLVAIIVLGSLWLTGRIVEARLRGGAVIVSEDNFPEIAERTEAVSQQLGYKKPVTVFVVQDGEINAFLWRVFGRKYLALNSGLVQAMSPDEQTFIIARFIGALQARYLRFHEAASFVSGLERLWVLNVLILPYLRTTVLSGDRVGLMVCGEFDTARRCLDKMLIGNDLWGRLSLDGVLAQGQELRQTIFRTLSTLFSAHPHMTDRYIELVTYARSLGSR